MDYECQESAFITEINLPMKTDDLRSRTSMNKSYQDRLWLILLWAVFAGILVSIYFYSESREFDQDEFEHIHTAWKIFRGQEIYVDFFQHHHPFLHYMLTAVIYIFGNTTESLFAGRHLLLLLTGGILTVTYLLSMKIFRNSEVGVISLILTSTVATFYMKTIEIRPDVPQTLAALISIYFLFVFYDKGSLKPLVASAAFLAVSFLFLQKSIALIPVILVLFLYDLWGRAIRPRDVLIYAAVFILCISPYYIYLLASGSFRQYFALTWLVNLYFEQKIGIWVYALATLRENTITCVLYLIGVVALFKSKEHRRFSILSIGLLLTVPLMFKNLWRQYYMLAIPPLGIVASYTLYTVFQSKYSRFVVIMGAIYLPMAIMHNHGFFKMDITNQMSQIDKINYVLSITDENDKVYDGYISFNLYRDDVDYLWFCVSDTWCQAALKKASGYNYDIFESISTQKPKVISTFAIQNPEDPGIGNYYRKSEKYDDLLIRVEK